MPKTVWSSAEFFDPTGIGNHTQSDGDRTLTEQPRRISNPARKQAVGICASTGKTRLQRGNRQSPICATPGTAWLQWGRDRVSGFASRLHAEGEPKDGLHPQHGTPKPCGLRRQRLRREIITGRSLLAQFGLTPKSKRGLAASDPGEVVDPLDAL